MIVHYCRETGRSILFAVLLTVASPLVLADGDKLAGQAVQPLTAQYHRLLPLEGGSNFRDFGGYKTEDGRTVVKGVLFRSGVMTALSDSDQRYLDQFGFKSVVDLRSLDEISVSPNHWVDDAGINYISHDYRFTDMIAFDSSATPQQQAEALREAFDMESLYRRFPSTLKPQFSLFFDELLRHQTPAVVNCSAGQDRTGATVALVLAALGVPEHTIVEDYLLSTDYRNGLNEAKSVDLDKLDDDNLWKQIMLRFAEGKEGSRPQILKNVQGTPYIAFLFDQIKRDYGSVGVYLTQEVGLSAEDIQQLKALYTRS